jgi:hypothetical protein
MHVHEDWGQKHSGGYATTVGAGRGFGDARPMLQ